MASCCKPEKTKFEITRFNLDHPKDSLAYQDWKKKNHITRIEPAKDTLRFTNGTVAGTLFYEDQNYKVFTDCHGEFGGSIIFQEKRNKNVIYYMESVCAVMIDRKKNGYYIVESLAHMDGFGKVTFIDSPKSLVQLRLNDLTQDWKSRKFPNLDEYEVYEKLSGQGKILAQGYGVMYDLMFEFNNKNYLVYSRNNETILGQILPDTLLPVDTLFHFHSYGTTDSQTYAIKDYHHYEFHRKSWSYGTGFVNTDEASGEIYVRNNTIVCVYSNKKRRQKENNN